MSAKEKAKQLIERFDIAMEYSTPKRYAKECALVAIDEIINCSCVYPEIKYFFEVKEEIEKL